MEIAKYGSAECSRLYHASEYSSQNFEDWEQPSTLVFACRSIVKRELEAYMQEYYASFDEGFDYCLDNLFM
jgi:hypothetical protein